MKNKINEEQVYNEAHAKELLNVKANYNKLLQELNNKLAKQISDLAVKYMKITQQQSAQRAAQNAAKAVTGTTTTNTNVASKTGIVDTAGNPVNADGSPATKESYSDILRVKERLNEETFDARYSEPEDIQDLKNYMDAENIPYMEDEDQDTLDFDKDELDPEWVEQLQQMGLEEIDKEDNVNTEDILDYSDDEEGDYSEEKERVNFYNDQNDEDSISIHNKIEEENVFYIKVKDDEGDFIGKVYRLFDDGEWRTKIVKGSSKTFEKLNYDPNFDEHDIIAFLRENYDDADLISKDEFNEYVENEEEKPDIEESHKIQTFDEFLNENS